MLVKLSSCGNPDFKQNPKDSMSPNQQLEVTNLKEASQACRAYIDEWDLGGGNWTGGQVFENGKQVARISYNGRAWDMEEREIILQ